MRDGFYRAAAVTPVTAVGDVDFNLEQHRLWIERAGREHVSILAFPELSLTGYTCGDLFGQRLLLDKAKTALVTLCKETKGSSMIVFAGLPFLFDGKLYNTAAAISDGKLLGLIPKKYLPDYHEFYEVRQFAPGFDSPRPAAVIPGVETMIGCRQLFCADGSELVIGAELCEDLWAPQPPSTAAARAGANVIVNLSASNEITAKASYRRSLVAGQSARLYCGYLYACAGPSESTQDLVFSGHDLICEGGSCLAESTLFSEGMIFSEFDIDRLCSERRRMTTFTMEDPGYRRVSFPLKEEKTPLSRRIDPAPFVPDEPETLAERCEEILNIQTRGLARRLSHTGSKKAALGISGGLDSTLALLICVRAFDLLGLDRSGICAVTMPGFGTTDRTYDNACSLIRHLHADLREIPIGEAVTLHFRDIGQDPKKHDVTYENSQARERTQILMDLANREGGLVIGTGDLSELALGWATYNGDHMSMYAVNSSVPKTLVRHLVRFCADGFRDAQRDLADVLYDILDTPVSPELLPPEEGKIAQKTEELVGPYELHDFFLYQFMRFGFSPRKIYRLAKEAFGGAYDDATILHWLAVFCRRFFSQQFKRSALPDGPKVGSVALSPRGDWRMPSDASAALWLDEIESLKKELSGN